jgi:transcriptional regulator with XRE-family HTH domain
VNGDQDAPEARIARARRRRGLSQAVLAGLVGRSESWLSQVERGKRTVDSYAVLTRMAAIAARLPAYAAADPAHVAVFARANRKMWDEIEAGRPVPWTKTMAAAARTWAKLREHPSASF